MPPRKQIRLTNFPGWLALISVPGLIWMSTISAQPAMKVTFLTPTPKESSAFWTQVTESMQAAAEDLGIDLQIAHSKNNTYSQKKDGLAALNNPDRPDYFISGYWMASSQHHIKHAEQLGIRTFIFNSGVSPEERAEMGHPREKYRYWIGQMAPDDYQAAYTLADLLINKAKTAKKTDQAGKIHMVAVGGDGVRNSVEEKRYSGLKERIAEYNDVVLEEFILTGWDRTVAYNELIEALKQHPETSAIWSIDDALALAAIDAAQNLNKTPGQDVFIGGFNWSLEGINAVISQRMTATMGGHALEGVQALILIHDYHHGLDFATELGVEMHSQMEPITIDNAKEYLNRLNKLDWHKVDFKQFSKKYNPGLKTYDLSLDALLGG